jgi:hypothetical protein
MRDNYYLHDDPRMPAVWGPWFSHEYIAYFTVQAFDTIMGLPPVPVRPNPFADYTGWPVGPEHVDLYKEAYRDVRRIDPFSAFEYGHRNGDFSPDPLADRTADPWKVLVIYTTEPDLNLDCGLFVHRRQDIMGGSHGWRHMRFRILSYRIGMAPESFRAHRDMAARAFRSGNDYWGWRMLSRCTHYLADLGNPLHVKAAPDSYVLRKILSSHELFKTASAVHTGYELYVERRFREGAEVFRDALIRGAALGRAAGPGLDQELNGYIRQAERMVKPIFSFMLERFGRDLVDAYGQVDKNSREDVATQTKRCAINAARVIFDESHRPHLKYLDDLTAVLLERVGYMLGRLLAEFSDR